MFACQVKKIYFKHNSSTIYIYIYHLLVHFLNCQRCNDCQNSICGLSTANFSHAALKWVKSLLAYWFFIPREMKPCLSWSFGKADRNAAIVFDLIWGPHFLLDWAHVLLWKIIQLHQSRLMSQYFEEIIEWGLLLPKKKNVLLSRAQQGEKDANDSAMPRERAAPPASKKAEVHGEFPGGPVIGLCTFTAVAPDRKTKIPQAARHCQEDNNSKSTSHKEQAEAYLTNSKNTTSEIARLSSNFAITTK